MPPGAQKGSYPFRDGQGANKSSPLNPNAQATDSPSSSTLYLPPGSASSTTNLLSPSSAPPSRSPSSRSTPGPRYQAAPLASPGSTSAPSIAPSISDKFSLSADPSSWGTELTQGQAEPDDYLHNPDPRRDRKNDQGGTIFTARGISNLGFLFLLAAGIIALFMGYPLISYFGRRKPTTLGGYNLGGINATGQVPEMTGNFALVDPATPDSALHYKANEDGSTWDLIFSDEFNTDGRTFYPGDDPYWEGIDLHYWQTNNLEWYDPAALTTKDGNLEITLLKRETNGMDYRGGLASSWNKFCFTGGYIEVNVSLPGDPKLVGLWPAIWMMGNLGRAGYGASLEGMWPYVYDVCDVGTLQNQTLNNEPKLPFHAGDQYTPVDPNDKDGEWYFSFLQGQRLSACTCPEDTTHPGPKKSDGSWTGRSAPEIDIFEATVGGAIDKNIKGNVGLVSQSAQYAPFDAFYAWKNGTGQAKVYNESINEFNGYRGGIYQEAVSGLSMTNQNGYQVNGGFSLFGVEYKPGMDGYITWYNDGKPAWTLYADGVSADPIANISARGITGEPLYIMLNLGISKAFGGYISDELTFPSIMKIDYVRVYQHPDRKNIGCNPPDYPTEAYINKYIEAYSNPNLTTWKDDYGQPIPKNRLIDQCDGS